MRAAGSCRRGWKKHQAGCEVLHVRNTCICKHLHVRNHLHLRNHLYVRNSLAGMHLDPCSEACRVFFSDRRGEAAECATASAGVTGGCLPCSGDGARVAGARNRCPPWPHHCAHDAHRAGIVRIVGWRDGNCSTRGHAAAGAVCTPRCAPPLPPAAGLGDHPPSRAEAWCACALRPAAGRVPAHSRVGGSGARCDHTSIQIGPPFGAPEVCCDGWKVADGWTPPAAESSGPLQMDHPNHTAALRPRVHP